jgi:hypothetical protein
MVLVVVLDTQAQEIMHLLQEQVALVALVAVAVEQVVLLQAQAVKASFIFITKER